MTTPKLHPAAIRAAATWYHEDDLTQPHALAKRIHAAIDDHLKSEGWEELRDKAQIVSSLIRRGTALVWVHAEAVELREALSRVRGEPSAGEEGKCQER